MSSPLSDVVAQQYERWIYPRPLDALDLKGARAEQVLAHLVYWPDRGYRTGLDILVAGCGSNQGALVAAGNPDSRVIGIDISAASLAHEEHLKGKYDLKNLELHRLPIERVAELGREFDLIVTSGVLHHMADPQAGMQALGGRLKPDGALLVLLYARYGRVGVEMVQSLSRLLALRQDEAGIGIVRDLLARLRPDHAIHHYARAAADDLAYDGGLVDTFLHGRDRSYTVGDCLDIVRGAGLAFQSWWENTAYYPDACLAGGTPSYQAIAGLDQERMWQAMEVVNAPNACHIFVACRPDRPAAGYTIDFNSPRIAAYTPVLRPDVVLVPPPAAGQPAQLRRPPGLECPLGPAHFAVIQRSNGRRTIGELAREAGVPIEFCRDLFRSMWRMGIALIRLPGA